jgi:hypothetical protein
MRLEQPVRCLGAHSDAADRLRVTELFSTEDPVAHQHIGSSDG